MSTEDGSKEPLANLGLSLNRGNHSIRLNDYIGAGVNATSKVDFTLMTSNPLSELVWSPRNGISVKSTDRSFTEKQSAFLWGLRSNNTPVSSTKSINTKRSNSDSFMDEKNDITSPCPVNSDKVETPGRYTESVVMGGLVQAPDEDTRDKTSEVHSRKEKTFGKKKRNEKVDLGVSLDIVAGIGENQLSGSSRGPYSRVGHSDPLCIVPGNASSIAIPSQEGPSRQHNVSTAFADQEGKSVLKTPGGAITENLDKVEFSAENCLLVEASKRVNPVTLNDHDNSCQQREGTHLVDGSALAGNYLINQRIGEYLRKGKGKALSDGDVNDQIADDDKSHGSAGSYNSMMLASSGNTKRNLDQKLIATSKRLKQSMGRDLDSAAFIRQSSSFMSWINNMIKGYPGCNQDDAPSSVLAGMLSTHAEHESCGQKAVACDHELKGLGFRNLFQSICCSNNDVKERKIYLDYQSNEESGDAKRSTMVNVSAVPLTVYEADDNVPEDICVSNKMCDQPTSENDTTSPSRQRLILSSNFPVSEGKILPRMNTISCNMASEMERAISSPSNSSVDKERANDSEYNDSKHTFEEKAAQATGGKRDCLGSLWITRFSPKVSQPASDKHLIKSKFISKRALPDSEKHRFSGNGLMNVVQGEHSFGNTMNTHSKGRHGFEKPEGLVGSEQVKVTDELKPEQNLEVMASVFARRLDALKQVIPFYAKYKPAPMTTTCFFCGVRGHDIQACSEISGSELQELFLKIESYDKVKDWPCLCIKCFELSHWAIECPQRPSRKSALGSFVDWSSDIDLYSYRRDKEKKSLLQIDDHAVDFKPDTELNQLQDSIKLDQEVCESSTPSLLMPNKNSVAMEGIFDAVRRLRLSRSDFLRLMDSQILLSHLRGFYARVRLSNCRESLGGKGYYVARIHGAPDEAGPKTRVAVTIGSFTCLVESRYISNQDFLEDELVRWWTKTSESGHSQTPPSLEELEQKYQERTRLGF